MMDCTMEELQNQLKESEQNLKETEELWTYVLNRKPYRKADWHIALACETMVKRYKTEIQVVQQKIRIAKAKQQ